MIKPTFSHKVSYCQRALSVFIFCFVVGITDDSTDQVLKGKSKFWEM